MSVALKYKNGREVRGREEESWELDRIGGVHLEAESRTSGQEDTVPSAELRVRRGKKTKHCT